MDTNILVKEGTALVEVLDEIGIKPIAAMWVHNTEEDTWQFWLVPSAEFNDKLEFFSALARVFAEHREKFDNLEISDVRFRTAKDPAISAVRGVIRLDGLGSTHLNNNRVNGFYLPDGIVLRMAA